MILGLDSNGNVYLCLTQVNTNEEIMNIYLRHLCEKLDREDAQWRDKMVIQLDNAYVEQVLFSNMLFPLSIGHTTIQM